MPAYLVVNIEVTDPEHYAEYVRVVPATLAKYGGRYLARGGRAETLEGLVAAKRVVLVEFPTVERAKQWWDSEEYRGPKALRRRTANASIILVEGMEPNVP